VPAGQSVQRAVPDATLNLPVISNPNPSFKI
jgi:hypothetical protein